jgi:hypothetical protein
MGRGFNDVLVRLVADFAVVVDGRQLYREIEVPVVELACWFLGWLQRDPELGDDFEWESRESDEPSWVWFRSFGEGWRSAPSTSSTPSRITGGCPGRSETPAHPAPERRTPPGARPAPSPPPLAGPPPAARRASWAATR